MRRILNNIKHHSNWLGYYFYKYAKSKDKEFTFQGRNGLKISVPPRLLPTYKECFFDETYFKGLPKSKDKDKPQTVIDIGANVGYFSLSVFSVDPKARVFAYEPMPNNFELLQKYWNENRDLDFTIINKAVSQQKENLVLNYDATDSYTTAASIFESKNQPNKIEVETISLEGIVHENDLNRIDFLKLDCEGSEYEIMYSCPQSILKKISVVAVETHKGNENNENIGALSAFLKENGFEIKIVRSKIWGWRTASGGEKIH